MSVYRCGQCENYFDGDYEGCFENPLDDCSNLCLGCSMEIEGELIEKKMEVKKMLNSLRVFDSDTKTFKSVVGVCMNGDALQLTTEK